MGMCRGTLISFVKLLILFQKVSLEGRLHSLGSTGVLRALPGIPWAHLKQTRCTIRAIITSLPEVHSDQLPCDYSSGCLFPLPKRAHACRTFYTVREFTWAPSQANFSLRSQAIQCHLGLLNSL